MIGEFFFTILHQPMYNVLIFFYDLFPFGGLGLAIILLTTLIKALTFPLTYKSMQSQKQMQEIQPKINEIKEKYKDDKEKLAMEMMSVYKNNKVNPLASCLPLILQMVIFIALYRVLATGLGEVHIDWLYPFITNPGHLTAWFLGIDLTKVSVILAILMAVAQHFQAKHMVSSRPPTAARTSGALDEDMMASMNKMMIYFLPAIILVAGVTTLPAGLSLYILVSIIITFIMQEWFIKRTIRWPWQKELPPTT